jgi:hypothetical protein
MDGGEGGRSKEKQKSTFDYLLNGLLRRCFTKKAVCK